MWWVIAGKIGYKQTQVLSGAKNSKETKLPELWIDGGVKSSHGGGYEWKFGLRHDDENRLTMRIA